MKTIEERILTNMLNELNMCKGKQSALRACNLSNSIVTERIEILERRIAAQKLKIEGDAMGEKK
jgi:hypothetical protein